MLFNGIDFGGYCIIENVRRDMHPPVTLISKEIPGRSGERFIRRELGKGIVEVDIRLIEGNKDDVQKKVREMVGILSVDRPKKLYFKDEPDKYYKAILSGNVPLDRYLYTGHTTLVFDCPDPIAYGEKVVVEDIDNKTIYNKGTYPSKGVIRVEIDEQVESLDVTLHNTGEFISIYDDFEVGDIVVIDLETEHVTKNGHSAMKDLALESDFFELPVGEFKILAPTGATTLEFRGRWL